MPKPSRDRLPLRQFSCCKHRWGERVPNENPQSKCRRCEEMREATPKGEEVGVCKFECEECGNHYTVKCRMRDTAECYKCGKQDVKPVPGSITFHRHIRKKPGTPNKHSCSRCHGEGNCPNNDWNDGPAKVHVSHKELKKGAGDLLTVFFKFQTVQWDEASLTNGIECVSNFQGGGPSIDPCRVQNH